MRPSSIGRNKMPETVITNNLIQTQKLAANLAKQIASKPGFDAIAAVIGLFGELGSGKTSFAQGFAKALGIKEKITSPTFVIMKVYGLKTRDSRHLIHVDAYRIQNPKEILDLGWKEIVANPKNIIIIEWAERLKKILPKNYIQIRFEHLGGDKRKIVL